MYKDKEERKKYFKEYMARRRKGLTVKPHVKPDNVKPSVKPVIPLIINDPDDVPVIPKKYRDDLMSKESAKRLKALPGDVQRGIEDVLVARKRLGLFDDSEERIERAERYQKWNIIRLKNQADILS